MAIANPYQQYQQQSVMTHPRELTLMLYNGASNLSGRPNRGLKPGYRKGQQLHNTVPGHSEELMVTLKPEYEISASLSALYDYIYNRLIDANIAKDISILDEVLGLVTELRDTWAEVIR